MPLRVRILVPSFMFVLLAALWLAPVAVAAQQAGAPAAETPTAEASEAAAARPPGSASGNGQHRMVALAGCVLEPERVLRIRRSLDGIKEVPWFR